MIFKQYLFLVIADNYLIRPTFLFAGRFEGIKEGNNGVLEVSWYGLRLLMLCDPDPGSF